MQSIKASIVIRTFNEEKHIGKLLTEIFSQETSFLFEVILVDSGSNDNTIEIASHFNVNIVQITPEEFTFGRSLNRGIEKAQGEFCVFVSAHCFPVTKHWLENLIKPFSIPTVSIVYGKQEGTETTKYSEHQIFARWYPELSTNKSDLAFCNNANCAIRKSDWKYRKYDESLTGLEDLDFAKYIFSLKRDIAYRADASVFHIHDESPKQIMNRYYREAFAYKEIYKNETFTIFDFVKFFGMNVVGDYIHSIQDGQFWRNMYEIPLFRFMQFWGTYKAHRFNRPISKEMQRRLFFPKKPIIFKRNNKRAQIQNFRVYDVSREITPTLAVWPGSRPFQMQTLKNIENDQVHESEISMNIHTATHMDAPKHFVKDGLDVSSIELQKCMGNVLLVECLDRKIIDVDFLSGLGIAPDVRKLLFKTLNSSPSQDRIKFDKDFVAITSDAAQWLVDNGIELVGIDGPSIQLFHDVNNKTHEILLSNNVVVVEGLNLNEINPGTYTFIGLPLKISSAEGSPIRAILMSGTLS